MKLSEQLSENLIKLRVTGESKYQIIEELIGFLGTKGKLKNKEKALNDVIEREQYLSTGLENGLAVPHGKTSGVDKLTIALGITKEGIDFDSLDGKPSNLIFLLLSPKDTSGPHIQALAQIARNLKGKEIRDKLLQASTEVEVMDVFREIDNEE